MILGEEASGTSGVSSCLRGTGLLANSVSNTGAAKVNLPTAIKLKPNESRRYADFMVVMCQ